MICGITSPRIYETMKRPPTMHMWERERERGEKKTARYVVVKDPERQSIIIPIWHVRSKPIFHYTRRASLECRTYLIFKVKTKDEKKKKKTVLVRRRA